MKRNTIAAAIAAALLSTALPAGAVTFYGSLSNFDVLNDNTRPDGSPEETEGFEIELHGVSSSDVSYTFGAPYNRFGDPTITSFAGGIYVRWQAAWDPATQTFSTATPHVPAGQRTPSGHDCYSGGPVGNYLSSGCEHFGVGLNTNQTVTTYRWLNGDAVTGTLTAIGGNVALPAPIWNVLPNPVAGNPQPIVQAVIRAPEIEAEDEAAGLKFGEAVWVKVTKTEVQDMVRLEDLVSDDEVIEAAEVETEWKILQSRLRGNDEENEFANEAEAGEGAKQVIRRYEFYRYTGLLNEEGEVVCADGSCDLPGEGELGDYIGSQMAAANLAPMVPVPEPETYALMLAGLALVAGVARRQRKS